MAPFEGNFAFDTNRGRVRLSNEDQARVVVNSNKDVLLVVCDGMGGEKKGDYASRYACSALVDAFMKRRHPWFSKLWLYHVIKSINRDIYSDSQKNPLYEGMGTTMIAILIEGKRMIVANIGDSRAYSYGFGMFERLSEDQTYVDYLYRTGKIEESETQTRSDRHMLMNALGIFPSVSIDIVSKRYIGQSLMCCSDGLYNLVSEQEIRQALFTDDRPEVKVSSLIAQANGNGGSDNIAIAIWEAAHDQNR